MKYGRLFKPGEMFCVEDLQFNTCNFVHCNIGSLLYSGKSNHLLKVVMLPGKLHGSRISTWDNFTGSEIPEGEVLSCLLKSIFIYCDSFPSVD